MTTSVLTNTVFQKPVFAYLLFNLTSKLQNVKLQISTDWHLIKVLLLVMTAICDWWHSVIKKFASGPTKIYLSWGFWGKDFNVVIFFIYAWCINRLKEKKMSKNTEHMFSFSCNIHREVHIIQALGYKDSLSSFTSFMAGRLVKRCVLWCFLLLLFYQYICHPLCCLRSTELLSMLFLQLYHPVNV